ncbi:MAG: glycosyltransferase family 1 protein [Rhodospirillaceae bacterium]|jgi:spore maturation protein CgeB|nr:glycosyltransferase family 1 protein [Rhodospirillaceae bacterium]MBT4588660.1 glycosyltransferase family 1 protein [Rhodospirillaceae bacterium]MBT4940909.1 glycosyltransferase family 1 protein [Rhodospirillaceae bacterium]MBT5939893.1 glycosyltransferase family 1 protein [Rhodospirillaceae bacterium]MBT7265385.1 glycosyltransferase family 1 protein [Rhodospirillaceae bacterium]
MRIIENRTGNSLTRPLRILSLLRGQWDGQREPALQALADMGHEVIYVDQLLPLDGYQKLVQRIDFDVAVLWGNSLQNLLNSFDGNLFLDEANIPYVTLWTDHPSKHLPLLERVKTSNHKAMFIPDSQALAQFQNLGWENVFYLPPWHIDPDIFKPMPRVPELAFEISFAATLISYEAERAKWREGFSDEMNAAADKIVAKGRATKDFVDVVESAGTDFGATTEAFSKIAHAMHYEQKALAREYLIEAMGEQELHIVGIGSAATNRANIILHEGREWDDLSPLFCSSAINLNLTQWPNSCHHRVFQITASGAFVLTDWRDDAISLFEPNEEAVYFKSLDELPSLFERYLNDPEARARIAAAGRKRFLAEHTATHRMAELSAKLYDLL